MKADASRSIIQTTIKRWASSGSVVQVDPTGYLSIKEVGGGLTVSPSRAYPEGLGYGANGFALDDGARVRIPLMAFLVWYYRTADLGDDDSASWIKRLKFDLSLTEGEAELVFSEAVELYPALQNDPISDEELHELVLGSIEKIESGATKIHEQSEVDYQLELRSMVTSTEGRPAWLTEEPGAQLDRAIKRGAKAILLAWPSADGKESCSEGAPRVRGRGGRSRSTRGGGTRI